MQVPLSTGLRQPNLGEHARFKPAEKNSRMGVGFRDSKIIALACGTSGPGVESCARARKRDRICGTGRLERRRFCGGGGCCQSQHWDKQTFHWPVSSFEEEKCL